MTMDDRAEIAALLDRHQLCIDLRDNDGSYESPFAKARGVRGRVGGRQRPLEDRQPPADGRPGDVRIL